MASFGSLVFHCPPSFVLRVRVFLHIVYLALIVIFASVLSLVALGPVYSLMFGSLLVLVFRPYLACEQALRLGKKIAGFSLSLIPRSTKGLFTG